MTEEELKEREAHARLTIDGSAQYWGVPALIAEVRRLRELVTRYEHNFKERFEQELNRLRIDRRGQR